MSSTPETLPSTATAPSESGAHASTPSTPPSPDGSTAKPRRYNTEILLISFAALLLEVSYTRVISFKLFYYYTYLVIGLALLGIGCGGVVVALQNALAAEPRCGWLCHYFLTAFFLLATVHSGPCGYGRWCGCAGRGPADPCGDGCPGRQPISILRLMSPCTSRRRSPSILRF